MRSIDFTKMSGAGNDFIVVDNRDETIAPSQGRRGELFRAWCTRRLGIGADGVLLVERPADAESHFRMRYYNADGGEGDSCGNGARCIARFAYTTGIAPQSMAFNTKVGLYRAQVIQEDVRLSMTAPHSLRRDVVISIPGVPRGTIDYINTGVPHAVLFVEDIESAPVDVLGKRLRHHEYFSPENGTNVDFAQVLPDGRILMRTYERGVECETLACGTGSVAVGLTATLRGMAKSPVSVVTRGGPVLKIAFEVDGDSFTDVTLEGEARIVYEGKVADSA